MQLKNENLTSRPNISENLNLLEELVADTNEELQYCVDQDAKQGHKTCDSSFFGYKTHIAMTPERIITAATVTTGEKHDGKELKSLVKKTIANGIDVENVVGDGAYSEKENIDYTKENDIKLVSKLSKTVTDGNKKVKDLEFTFNKDAGMYVCPAGHMAFKKTKKNSRKKDPSVATYETYFFNVNKCKNCPLKDKCGYKGGNSKTYSVTIKMSNSHKEHNDNQQLPEYQELAKERYKIEAKNSELKNQHGYSHTSYNGLHGMTLQAGISIFVMNLKRILRLKNESK